MKTKRHFTSFIICFFIMNAVCVNAQINDNLPAQNSDSGKMPLVAGTLILDTAGVHPPSNNVDSTPKDLQSITQKLILRNRFINIEKPPVYQLSVEKNSIGKEFLFYAVCIIVLILALFKTFYSAYFNNLFTVFFNTSLRQTQLMDQLLQAKLPSLILNIFFTISAGTFIWLLLKYFNPPGLISPRLLLPFCVAGMAIIYFVKFILLKFTGWVADVQTPTDNYIFIIFLVNKITGILLVPFIVLLSFSMKSWIGPLAILSLLMLGLLFFARYIKSYGIIKNKLSLNVFHFIIYVAGAELIPLLIIYKVAVDYLG